MAKKTKERKSKTGVAAAMTSAAAGTLHAVADRGYAARQFDSRPWFERHFGVALMIVVGLAVVVAFTTYTIEQQPSDTQPGVIGADAMPKARDPARQDAGLRPPPRKEPTSQQTPAPVDIAPPSAMKKEERVASPPPLYAPAKPMEPPPERRPQVRASPEARKVGPVPAPDLAERVPSSPNSEPGDKRYPLDAGNVPPVDMPQRVDPVPRTQPPLTPPLLPAPTAKPPFDGQWKVKFEHTTGEIPFTSRHLCRPLPVEITVSDGKITVVRSDSLELVTASGSFDENGFRIGVTLRVFNHFGSSYFNPVLRSTNARPVTQFEGTWVEKSAGCDGSFLVTRVRP